MPLFKFIILQFDACKKKENRKLTINFFSNNAKIHGKQTLSIIVILLLTVSGMMMAIPTSKAQTAASPYPTHAFVAVAPNPIGVGQTATIEMWLEEVNPTASGPSGGRWQGFTVLVTKPDATTQTLGPFTANDASFAVTTYTPTTTGNYTFEFSFPGQHVVGLNGLTFMPTDIYFGASSFTTTLTVQQQPATVTPQAPLPMSYWTRPVNSQNDLWYTISGNWLGLGADLFGSHELNVLGNFQQYSNAPDSAHIVWTKPLMAGGLIGGEFGGNDTSNYYTGRSYEALFTPPVIINGVLYYNSPTPPKEGFYAVDLRTGQTLWWQNSTGPAFLSSALLGTWGYAGISLGQIYNYLSPNQEGALPYLWYTGSSTWYMYDANTGNLILQFADATPMVQFSGISVEGPGGELDVYFIGNNWLAMWNSSLCIGTLGTYVPITTNFWTWRPPTGMTLNWSKGIQWNVTTSNYPGQSIESIGSGVILATTLTILSPAATFATDIGYSSTTGQQLWVKNITLPEPATGFEYGIGPMADGIFTAYNSATEEWYGFSATTGDQLWGPTVADTNPWGSEGIAFSSQIAYGILYGIASDGISAFNVTTGQKLWQFTGATSGLDFPGFSTYPFEQTDLTIADGKVYIETGVSHGDPNFRGAQLYCINATTGHLIWSVNGFFEANMPVSDGYLVGQNGYDNQIYCFGMGPSKTTVSAPSVGVTTATPITITGTVMDISAGSQQQAVAANFPNGLPCVSDASMTQFMQAVYMQQPMPTNVTGVPVTLSVTDSNGNHYSIGTTTTNAMGEYGLTWTPIVPGNYTLYATFGGTDSYYGSSASTYFYAGSPPATPAPTASPPSGLASTSSLELGIAAVIIVIVILGVAILAVLMRKRP